MSKSNQIYYSVTIPNNDQLDANGIVSTPTQPINCSVQDARNQPILNNPGEWEVAIVSFSVPSSNIPLFVFEEAVVPFVNFNKGYWVTIQIGAGAQLSQSVMNFPQQTFLESTGRGPSHPYSNYIYSYVLFITQVNNAIQRAWIAAVQPANKTPFIHYNSDTQLFTLYVDNTAPRVYYDGSNGADPNCVRISFNNKLMQFFYFPNQIQSETQQLGPPPDQNLILFQNTSQRNAVTDIGPVCSTNAPNVTFTPAGNWLTLTQSYNTLALWSVYDRILFFTNMGVVLEQVADAGNLGATQGFGLLADYMIADSIIQDKSSYTYLPTGGYKWNDMLDSGFPLHTLDLRIYLEGKNSSDLIPVKIGPQEKFSCKLCFRKKARLVRGSLNP